MGAAKPVDPAMLRADSGLTIATASSAPTSSSSSSTFRTSVVAVNEMLE